MGNNPSALAVGTNLPANWTYYGCYTDYGRRKLAGSSYALDIIVPINTTNTTLSPTGCNVTTSTDLHIANGGFEDGLANWTAVAYNSSWSTFEIGVIDEALEGCTALTAVPKPDSRSLSYHFQTSTLLTNLEPERNYTINISIGHHEPVPGQNAYSDPKYTIRLSDNTLDFGAICGFAYAPCPLIGRNGSIYETLSLPFQAESIEETLTVYLSWYNGNFDVPLYLDGVTVKPASDDSPTVERTASSNSSSPTTAYESLLSPITTASTAAMPTKTPLELTCKTPEACPDRPRTEITNNTLANGGFENGLTGWDFLPQAGNFDITLTNQSFEGGLAAAITPRMPDTSTQRSINVVTRLTNLNYSHEWYTVQLHVGHPGTFTLLNGSPPWLTLSYKSAVTGDIQRRVGLCGEVGLPFIGGPGECEFVGKDGQLYQRYGMDTRSFYGTDGIYTNATEMEIELEIVWPVGTRNVPVYVDAMHVWEIEFGTVS
ncbi:hypothetical protein E8E12_003176 [Didymella heteroderae]|uniref:Uncharacterized protein n=1 Tax=Didymella heteroderae TaxID=1769908 RepID=A0A9P4WMN5_9PLEO|nr:hypothetical protein E8E12_003176 [Didymella heteroderae]